MNERQKKAFYNIKWAANELTGELENATYDYPEDSEEYNEAMASLNDHKYLVDTLYHMATTAIYGEGYCCFNAKVVGQELRDINFCGKEWLMEACENRIAKLGY